MLQDILNGQERTQVIVIKDHIHSDGVPLLKCILTSLSLRVEKIHLFLLEKLPQSMRDLPEHTVNRLSVHNITKDPLGWDGNTTVTMETNLMEYLTKYMSSRRHRKVAVVIDSVSNLILHRGAAYTCQVLHRCSRLQQPTGIEVCPVVTVVHPDLHDNTTINMLDHTATCVLDLGPPVLDGYHGSCNILHKKPSGKVVRVKEQYKMKRSCELEDVEELRDSLAGALGTPDGGIDPAANLTFNLTLNDKEKEARSKVILPYLRQPERSEMSVSSGSGKIFYQPDEADDFDEEDPDDDLDI